MDGCEVSAKAKEKLEAKILKLKRFNPLLKDPSTKIHLKIVRGVRHEKPNYGLHLQLTIPGHSLRAKGGGKTLLDALDVAEEKLAIQIKKIQT